MAEEPIGLYYTPANEGDHFTGLPARDLTEDEVAYYLEHEPGLMRDATTPNATTGEPMYSESPPAAAKAARKTRTTKEADEAPPEDGDA